ncbi:MAG: HAD-IC family P-type ATPase, partial [Bosea sp.]|nr:HAD-IC family P-type ATPase [Bosea sp. (in: a-proteobacteria)]
VVKYRKLLLEVLTVSFFLQLFALVTPLFFQVVMDKVLVHHAMTTLTVITIGLLVITLFNVVLAGLRTYVFAHTTSRIDVELGARLFRHILALPLAYFESRRVGDTIARVRELENIRNFLTGQTLTSVLDLLFTFVFLAVMFFYSGWLTLIVVISLPLGVLAAWRHGGMVDRFVMALSVVGFSVPIFVIGYVLIAVFAVDQHLRPDAAASIRELRALGLDVVILSGDRVDAVAPLAGQLGIAAFKAGQRPDEKIAELERLAAAGRRTLMVGDGLNDAPALARAHASMSPISATQLAQASADIVFLGEELAPVAASLRIARKARRLMVQNLWFAVLYNAIAVPIAIAGFATPLVAAVAMSGSSLVVTLNALRAGRQPAAASHGSNA